MTGPLPCGGGHDAASTVDSHPTTAATLRGVVVHAEVVSQLMCQSHGCTQRVLRVILVEESNPMCLNLAKMKDTRK